MSVLLDRAALAAVIGGQTFALPVGEVRRVADVPAVTALPLAPPWIEGLVAVDGLPLPLLDVTGGVGGVGAKLVVIEGAGGVVAVRVERVAPLTGSWPLVPVAALVQRLTARRPVIWSPVVASGDEAAGEGGAVALVVAVGATRAAILIDEGVRVDQVAACVAVGTETGVGHLMATVGDRRLPARALIAGDGDGEGRRALDRAVIGRGAEGWAAVLVERLIGLERVRLRDLVVVPGAALGRNLCFPDVDGSLFLLQDFATMAGGGALGAGYRHLLERVHERGLCPEPPRSRGWGGGGLLVSVAGVRWLLPFAVVERMLGVDERPGLGRSRPPGGVPVCDVGHWFARPGRPGRPMVMLRLAERLRIALRVDHVALEVSDGAEPWQAPPVLPPGLAALVGAVRLEPESGLWCLRLEAGLEPMALPWSFRRAVAAACLGRLASGGALHIHHEGA